jgi:hypothetical protein
MVLCECVRRRGKSACDRVHKRPSGHGSRSVLGQGRGRLRTACLPACATSLFRAVLSRKRRRGCALHTPPPPSGAPHTATTPSAPITRVSPRVLSANEPPQTASQSGGPPPTDLRVSLRARGGGAGAENAAEGAHRLHHRPLKGRGLPVRLAEGPDRVGRLVVLRDGQRADDRPALARDGLRERRARGACALQPGRVGAQLRGVGCRATEVVVASSVALAA